MSSVQPEIIKEGWMFSKEYYSTSTPSRLIGMTESAEYSARYKSVVFLEKLGIELRCNKMVVSTAAVMFHRFYARQSFKLHNRFLTIATCLFVASKVEEEMRYLDDIASFLIKVSKE